MSKEEKNQVRKHTKEFDTTVELVDIDHAIKNYIEENIAQKFLNKYLSQGLTVPVLMKNPELWVDKKDLSSIKDITGNHYKFPIIGISRSGIDIIKNRVPHWIKDEDLSYIVNKGYNASNKEDGDPYYRMVRRPVYVDASYEFEIISDSAMHVNYLTEQFVYHEGKYWGDGEKYSFQTSFNSVLDSSMPASGDQERLVLASISASCRGRILPKYMSGEEKAINFIQSINKVELDEKIIPVFDKIDSGSFWDD